MPRASWIAKRLAGFLAPARVEVAYPGLWLRDDVYATHGHYLDVHVTIPTIERLAAGVMARLVGAIPDPATPDDYEAVLAPIYALSQASAQRGGQGRAAVGSRSAVGTWRALAGDAPARGGCARRRSRCRSGSAWWRPTAPGSGPCSRRSAWRTCGSPACMRSARRRGACGSRRRISSSATPTAPAACRDDDRRVAHAGRHAAAQHRLLDLRDAVHGARPAGSSPYWPGGAIAIDDDGPPRLERLLGDVPASALHADGRS